MHTLSELSRKRLRGVHPDMVRVVERAIQNSPNDFLVCEGLRTVERQKTLVATGKSTTMNSRHITGHAVDVCAMVDGKLQWGPSHSGPVADAIKQAAQELGVEIVWGGDWKSFIDPPHFQLDWKSYPKQDTAWKDGGKANAILVADKPAPMAAKETVANLAKTSRKWKALDWMKGVFGAGGVSTAGIMSADGVTAAQTYVDAVTKFVTSYGAPLMIFACVGGFVVSQIIQMFIKQDVESGRYTASGEAKS